jgi:hypothetical protein
LLTIAERIVLAERSATIAHPSNEFETAEKDAARAGLRCPRLRSQEELKIWFFQDAAECDVLRQNPGHSDRTVN